MNWEKRYRKPQKGDKVKVSKDYTGFLNSNYVDGNVYTLLEKYLVSSEHDWWSTEECPGNGIHTKQFEVLE